MYVQVDMYVCVCETPLVHTFMYMYVFMYLCMYVCMYVCMYAQI